MIEADEQDEHEEQDEHAGQDDHAGHDDHEGHDHDEDDEEAAPKSKRKATLTPGLSGKQRRHLRALGHSLKPVLQIGNGGVTDAVVDNAFVQLEAHELIKVKVLEGAPEGRHSAAEDLADKTDSALAQVLGRTFLLYRRRKNDPKIVLPK